MPYSFPINTTQIMGILNLTPDSFSDGGDYMNPGAALRRALEIQAEGADILDVGAQSTRPRHVRISAEEEMRRLLPVLEALRSVICVPISIDTFYPEVAKAALERGAAIINDVSGRADAEMAKVIRMHDAGWILTHNGPGSPEKVKAALASMVSEALAAGLRRERLCVDPGIGFGKSRGEDLALLRGVTRLRLEGLALLIGASRKRVVDFAAGGGTAPGERLAGTIAAHTAAQLGGANILRAHDVKEAVQAMRVTHNILG
ncbi:MAG: dihydropteroate synthase [Oscillospiraceae bacterium]|nr:dihydropteroate synthase [Oscillospiraceae bacterium]